MRAVSKGAEAVLSVLVEGLGEPGTKSARLELDRSSGGYMPVVVERVAERRFSVAHYYVQNGDRMRDPEVVFFRGADGRCFPIEMTQDPYGCRVLAELREDGSLARYRPKAQREVATFCTLWMRNVKAQQGIGTRARSRKARVTA